MFSYHRLGRVGCPLTPTWSYYPPVIKVPDLPWKFLWFFLYKILEFVYPPFGREVLMRIPRRNY